MNKCKLLSHKVPIALIPCRNTVVIMWQFISFHGRGGAVIPCTLFSGCLGIGAPQRLLRGTWGLLERGIVLVKGILKVGFLGLQTAGALVGGQFPYHWLYRTTVEVDTSEFRDLLGFWGVHLLHLTWYCVPCIRWWMDGDSKAFFTCTTDTETPLYKKSSRSHHTRLD